MGCHCLLHLEMLDTILTVYNNDRAKSLIILKYRTPPPQNHFIILDSKYPQGHNNAFKIISYISRYAVALMNLLFYYYVIRRCLLLSIQYSVVTQLLFVLLLFPSSLAITTCIFFQNLSLLIQSFSYPALLSRYCPLFLCLCLCNYFCTIATSDFLYYSLKKKQQKLRIGQLLYMRKNISTGWYRSFILVYVINY